MMNIFVEELNPLISDLNLKFNPNLNYNINKPNKTRKKYN